LLTNVWRGIGNHKTTASRHTSTTKQQHQDALQRILDQVPEPMYNFYALIQDYRSVRYFTDVATHHEHGMNHLRQEIAKLKLHQRQQLWHQNYLMPFFRAKMGRQYKYDYKPPQTIDEQIKEHEEDRKYARDPNYD